MPGTFVWLPPSVAEGLMYEAEGRKEARRLEPFLRELKGIDERLSCFLQLQNQEELKEGFYYIKRHNEDGTIALWEVCNPDGSYREPDDAVLNWLRSMDSWKGNAKLERQKERDKRQKAKEKRQAEKSREFTETLNDRIKFNHTPKRPRKNWG